MSSANRKKPASKSTSPNTPVEPFRIPRAQQLFSLKVGCAVYLAFVLLATLTLWAFPELSDKAIRLWSTLNKSILELVTYVRYFAYGVPLSIVSLFAIVGAITMFPILKVPGLSTIEAGLFGILRIGRSWAFTYSLWAGSAVVIIVNEAIAKSSWTPAHSTNFAVFLLTGVAANACIGLADIHTAQQYIDKYFQPTNP